jgi:hypothetical protein
MATAVLPDPSFATRPLATATTGRRHVFRKRNSSIAVVSSTTTVKRP